MRKMRPPLPPPCTVSAKRTERRVTGGVHSPTAVPGGGGAVQASPTLDWPPAAGGAADAAAVVGAAAWMPGREAWLTADGEAPAAACGE